MIEPRSHAENRNFIETILHYIPGFSGYLGKENRRESDDLQRDWLADRLQRSKRGLDNLARPLADAGQIDLLPTVDRLRSNIDRLIGRIRGAMQGYSGFFDLVRVDEKLLDRIYEHDAALVTRVDQFGDAVERLPEEQDKAGPNLNELLAEIDQLQELWDVREDMLKGLE